MIDGLDLQCMFMKHEISCLEFGTVGIAHNLIYPKKEPQTASPRAKLLDIALDSQNVNEKKLLCLFSLW